MYPVRAIQLTQSWTVAFADREGNHFPSSTTLVNPSWRIFASLDFAFLIEISRPSLVEVTQFERSSYTFVYFGITFLVLRLGYRHVLMALEVNTNI